MVGGKSQGKDNRRSDHGEEDMDAIEDQPSQDEKAHPEFCSNSKCDVNKDEEGKQLPSSTSVHPKPHLGNNMQLFLPHQTSKP